MYRSATLKSPAAFAGAASRGVIGNIVVATIRAVRLHARRAYVYYRQRRKAKAAYDALRHLDDLMLHDLGFDRSEITSVAAEVSGAAARTRVRLLPMSHSSP